MRISDWSSDVCSSDLDPAVTRRLVERWAELDERTSAAPSPTPAGAGDLTGREREILVGLARGRTNRHLADVLFVSEATVKTHVSSLLMKLGVRSRVQAVILAYEKIGTAHVRTPATNAQSV